VRGGGADDGVVTVQRRGSCRRARTGELPRIGRRRRDGLPRDASLAVIVQKGLSVSMLVKVTGLAIAGRSTGAPERGSTSRRNNRKTRSRLSTGAVVGASAVDDERGDRRWGSTVMASSQARRQRRL